MQSRTLPLSSVEQGYVAHGTAAVVTAIFGAFWSVLLHELVRSTASRSNAIKSARAQDLWEFVSFLTTNQASLATAGFRG